MAHANPEFALAARAHRGVPEPTAATLADLRARMRGIGERVRAGLAHPVEVEAHRLWQAHTRHASQIAARARGLDAALAPAPGMHGGEPHARFVPPTPRGHGPTKRFAQR